MPGPEETVRNFCAAWPRLNLEEVMAYFTDDAIYHNIPLAPLSGRDAVRKTIEGFVKGWQKAEFELLNIAAAGDVVFTERIDHIDAGGKHVDLPVAGVFELRDGKIAAWRDYFDLPTYTKAMS